MADPSVGVIHYIQANKKGQRVGVKLGTKVIHFTATADEQFAVDEPVYVTLHRGNPAGDVLGTN